MVPKILVVPRSWDPVILSILECLGVKLLLGVVGLGAELAPKVCSGYWLRLEGTCGLARVPVSLDPASSIYYQF